VSSAGDKLGTCFEILEASAMMNTCDLSLENTQSQALMVTSTRAFDVPVCLKDILSIFLPVIWLTKKERDLDSRYDLLDYQLRYKVCDHPYNPETRSAIKNRVLTTKFSV